jgi:TRAP-type mannitol/chloroaromatic compound transport system substrate-binding protein
MEAVSMRRERALSTILLIITLLMVAGSGCAATEPATPTQGGSPAAAEQKVIEWTGQSHGGSATVQYTSLLRVGERVEAVSGGRLKMTSYFGGGLVPATEEWPAVDNGTLDFSTTCWMFLRTINPSAGLFTTIAGGMTPMQALAWNNDGGGFKFAEEMLESTGMNVVALEDGGWMGPPEIFVSTTKPLSGAGDFKGMTIRGAGDAAEVWATLGPSMVFIPPGEVFEAMHRGVIDGYEVSMPTIDWAFGLQEAAKYIYLSPARQPYEYNPFIVNGNKWADLPDDLKEVVIEVNQAETIRAYTEAVSIELTTLEKFRDYGVNVEHLPKSLEDEYATAARTYYANKAGASEFNKRVLDSYWAFKDSVQDAWPGL